MVAPIVNMPNTEKHSGVSGIPTQLFVLHSGECPLRGGFAQSLTSWGNIPLAQGGPEASWHWFVDPIAIVAMVDPNYAAWHASEANPLSEGFEQAGYARFSRGEWLTPEGLKQIENLAWIMAQRAKACDIPPVWLTTAQVIAACAGNRSIKGFATHRQIDPETRTDPGDGYPYDLLMRQVKAYLGGAAIGSQGTTTPTVKDWFDMASKEDLRKVIQEENPWGYRNPKLERDDAYALLRATRTLAVKASADAAATRELVGQLANKQGVTIDYAKVDKIVKDALAAGVDVSVNVAGKAV